MLKIFSKIVYFKSYNLNSMPFKFKVNNNHTFICLSLKQFKFLVYPNFIKATFNLSTYSFAAISSLIIFSKKLI